MKKVFYFCVFWEDLTTNDLKFTQVKNTQPKRKNNSTSIFILLIVAYCKICHLGFKISVLYYQLIRTWQLRDCAVILWNINLFFLAWAEWHHLEKKNLTVSLSLGNRMFLSIISGKEPDAETPQHRGPCAHTHTRICTPTEKETQIHSYFKDAQAFATERRAWANQGKEGSRGVS